MFKSQPPINQFSDVKTKRINEHLTLYKYEEVEYINYGFLNRLRVNYEALNTLVNDLCCLRSLKWQEDTIVLVPLYLAINVQVDTVYSFYILQEGLINTADLLIEVDILTALTEVKSLFEKYL